MSRRASSGGAAAAGGFDFQARVSAWVAVQILAERGTSLPWLLPSDSTLEWLRCETEEPVDDLLVATSHNGFVFAQIKRTLNLSALEDSELASVLGQFVRQYLAHRENQSGNRKWQRSLDPRCDRLLLILGSNTPNTIRTDLSRVLYRLRHSPSQALDDSVANHAERSALSIVARHLRTAWMKVLGTPPKDEEIRQILSMAYLQVLDLDEGGAGEQEAKNMLRSLVLRDPSQADAAWRLLVSFGAQLASTRSGADRGNLQEALLSAAINLQATRSYREDIKKLREYSSRLASDLKEMSQLRIGENEVKIERSVIRELQRVTEAGSFLVVGEPGAGKSGALHDFFVLLGDKDAVLLAVDRIAAESLGELRTELGLDHEIADILANWPGTEAGFLVIDALDAARAELAALALRVLMARIVRSNGRWHVVASIRKFDLRYSPELRELFKGTPSPDFYDPEFSEVSHLNVPRLSAEELEQLKSASPALHSVVLRAPAELRELISVPFNLKLAAELLSAGLAPADLSPVRTQLQLLDRYWQYRIIRSDDQRDLREGILLHICSEMVKNRRLLVDRRTITATRSGPSLIDLLRHHVLSEWNSTPAASPEGYVLTFSHHVLFDYAVARLLLRGDHSALAARLAEERDLTLVVRPSLVLHFDYLWEIDRTHEQFWSLIFLIVRHERVPEIGKLIGPTVAARLARELSDFDLLCDSLEAADELQRNISVAVLRHIIGALLVTSGESGPIVGPSSGPWDQLVERVSRNFDTASAYSVRPLLFQFCQSPDTLTPEQMFNVGTSARRLLKLAWGQAPRDSRLVIHGLECVCRTFESDPIASAALIRRALEVQHIKEFGFEELPWLAREVQRLIPLDAPLVEEIYSVTFAHREESTEPTSLFESRIIGMISHRRQDFRMAHYALAEAYPNFLVQNHFHAVRTLIKVMEAFVTQEHGDVSFIEAQFDFRGMQARIRSDLSSIWDQPSGIRHDDALRILESFQRHVETASQGAVRALIETIVIENRLACIWRRLLQLAARWPSTIGRELLPLASARPILTFLDTSYLAGEFLKAIFVELEPSERLTIERAILAITMTEIEDEGSEHSEHVRKRLLGCLPISALVSQDARRLVEELSDGNLLPDNTPPFSFGGVTTHIIGEDDYLRGQGATLERDEDQRVRELTSLVKKFEEDNRTGRPGQSEVQTIIPIIRELKERLDHAVEDGVQRSVCNLAWDHLAEVSGKIMESEGFSCLDQTGALVYSVLIDGSRQSAPSYDPKIDPQFDESLSWGGPAPRVTAARGLILLARKPGCGTKEILEQIDLLSRDPVPAVRLQIAGNLNILYGSAEDLMWAILERLCREEESRGVLQFVISGSLERVAGSRPDRAVRLAKEILARVQAGPGADRVREVCVSLLARLYIWLGTTSCQEWILQIINLSSRYHKEAKQVVGVIREPLRKGLANAPDHEDTAVRQRAWSLVQRLTESAAERLNYLQHAYSGVAFDEWPESDKEELQALIQILDRIGSEIYFASGAYAQKTSDDDETLTTQQRKQFYVEATPVLDKLADVGIASLAHHLLQTLESFILFDPAGVFLRIGRVVRSGQAGGYQYESLAADLLVRLIERYLAEYRPLLRETQDCRAILLEVLDIFVQAGWPSARRLTYHLEEIFR